MKYINNKGDDFTPIELLSMGEDIKEMPLSKQLKNSIKERVMNRIYAPYPEGGVTRNASKIDWIKINDNFEVKILTQDFDKKIQSAYWRLKPGAIIPAHYHHNDEECIVMEGDIRFGEHLLFAGDFHVMKKGTTHPPLTTIGGAVLYLKHDIYDDISWLNG